MAERKLNSREIKKAKTNEEVIDLLRDDMKGEHAAIIQYLQHAYKMGEGEVGTEVEGIARDEMRHFRWLGELVVKLGGNPTMDRDPIFLDTPKDFQMMLLDVEAEDRAIEQYEAHLEAIENPKAKIIIERILVDERTHRAMFKDYVKELGGDPSKKINPAVGPWHMGSETTSQDLEVNGDGQTHPANFEKEGREDHPLVKLLNNRVRKEYLTILSYLHQGFVNWNTNPALSRSLIDDRAVWHMTHMGHIAEGVAGLKEIPEMVLPDLSRLEPGGPNQEFINWAIENEQELAENTGNLLKSLEKFEKGKKEDEELEDMGRQLKRFQKHNLFMKGQFENDRE